MHRRVLLVVLAIGGLALLISGCDVCNVSEMMAPAEAGDQAEYILAFNGNLPKNLEDDLAAIGGTIRSTLDSIGAVIVTSASPSFADDADGLRKLSAVIPSLVADWIPGDEFVEVAPEHIGSDETFFDAYQWSMLAIDAPGAWDQGYTGDGVRVAVCDTGIDPYHPDLYDNIDFVDSRSFVPYEPFLDDLDSHGTHVSGIIAAADNDYGSIGVAPNATIVTLKVLDGSGSGSFAWLLEALVYAATIDIDVVNMSLGAYFKSNGYYCPDPADPATWQYIGANEVAAFTKLVKDAVNEVWKSGAFVTTSAGNDFLDGTGDAGLLHLPGDACEKGVNVAATGPLGWFFDPNTDLDVPAFYTNYGASIDLAAPGGNVDFSLYPAGPWYFDLVFSTFAGGWGWMAGTSQASPHVAGVAALVIEANGGSMKPSHVETALKQSADDLGQPGFDPFYGHGRINAAEAVK